MQRTDQKAVSPAGPLGAVIGRIKGRQFHPVLPSARHHLRSSCDKSLSRGYSALAHLLNVSLFPKELVAAR